MPHHPPEKVRQCLLILKGKKLAVWPKNNKRFADFPKSVKNDLLLFLTGKHFKALKNSFFLAIISSKQGLLNKKKEVL